MEILAGNVAGPVYTYSVIIICFYIRFLCRADFPPLISRRSNFSYNRVNRTSLGSPIRSLIVLNEDFLLLLHSQEPLSVLSQFYPLEARPAPPLSRRFPLRLKVSCTMISCGNHLRILDAAEYLPATTVVVELDSAHCENQQKPGGRGRSNIRGSSFRPEYHDHPTPW